MHVIHTIMAMHAITMRLGHLSIKSQLILSDDDSVCIIPILLTTKCGQQGFAFIINLLCVNK
jgi:hypothetical protein